jgi:hypothetical protein
MDTRRMKLFIGSLIDWIIKIGKNVFSLTGVTCLCLLIFSVSITRFYYILATVKMDMMECIWFKDKWRNAIMGLGISSVFIFEFMGVRHFIQRQILNCFKVAIVLTYVLITGVYFGKISDPYVYFLALNIGTFIVTLLILISGSRHDLLSD